MDGYHDHPDEHGAAQPLPAMVSDVADAIGSDERRMHVRAYNYWVSLLEGRDYPSIEDLEPGNIEDFAPNSVLLDFTAGRDNPATPYIGTAIRDECDLPPEVQSIDEVPSRSLLSRLTDHYLQIIANRAPIGFEAEFVNQRGHSICYRGILMPFSSDGDTIDFIYGVINWKNGGDAPAVEQVIRPALAPLPDLGDEEEIDEDALEAEVEASDIVAEIAAGEDGEDGDQLPEVFVPVMPHIAWDDGPLAEVAGDDSEDLPSEVALDADAGLADRLSAARETAEAVKTADGRTRAALYRALGHAYDFALAARREPADYADLLEDSGLKAQARAPMTPIVKLVFGIDYDKARLTEFAAALANAERNAITDGAFQSFIEHQPGGLKALVAAERVARRPESAPDTRGEQARDKLRAAPGGTLADIATDGEFALVLTRRSASGEVEALAAIDDPAMLERAIRRTAG